MGWANCGEDSKGRSIGYAHEATCDHEGCQEKIDRGLSWICGRYMHGVCDWSCERYFCDSHVNEPDLPSSLLAMMHADDVWSVCFQCCQELEAAWKKGSFNTDIPEAHWPENYNPDEDEDR